MKKKAFRAALPYSLPICIGFLFIAMSYGFLMRSRGFSVFYPMAMSAFIFAGSMEFVAVELLLSAYAPLHAFLLTLMVNARHLFYGISMLEKYKGMGWKKPYLIFGMCDETFSINCTVTPPEGVDRGWFMFFVTLLNQTYWVAGATLGALSPAGMATNPNVRRHPKVGNNVVIYANSTLLGGATEIGDNVIVGGNAFLTSSVEPDTIVSVKTPELTFRGKYHRG